MKFFTVSLFVLLSSAILGGSFATPAHKDLGGLVGGVVDTVGNVVSDVAHLVDGVANTVSDVLRDALKDLPELTDNVLNAVNEVLENTGKGLALTARDVVDGVVNLVDEVLGDCITITIDLQNLKICIGDHIIGTILDDGSVVDLQNNLIGMFDREHGVLVFVGGAVDEVLHLAEVLLGCVGESLSNLFQSLDVILGDIIDNIQKLVVNISDVLRDALHDLPTATADILKKVEEELQKAKEGVVCVVENLLDNTLTFRDASGKKTLVSVDLNTGEVTLADHTIGHINQDGSIVDSDGNIIGCLITENGLLILVGEVVATTIHGLAQNVLNGLGNLLG